MAERDEGLVKAADYPVAVHVAPAIEGRNRLTTFFRFFLALPHTILVGAPIASVASFSMGSDGEGWEIGSSGGLVSAVIFFAVLFAWIAIVFTARNPESLQRLSTWYLRWRVKAIAYLTLLRDEYPPFTLRV